MGYTTKFVGAVRLSRPLTMAEAKQLLTFAEDAESAPLPNPGGYLQWVPSTSLDSIGWDGGEKFYDYTEWLQWVCNWLQGIGITAGGTILWSGEDPNDTGTLTVNENVVHARQHSVDKSGVFKPLTLRGLADIALDRATK